MDFEKSDQGYTIGKYFGQVVGFFLFTTILFFVLTFLNKLPSSWNYFYVMIITISVTLLGYLAGRLTR